MRFIHNLLTDYDDNKLLKLSRKYPSQSGNTLRLIHNEVLEDCVNHLRNKNKKSKVNFLSIGSGYNYNLNYVGNCKDTRTGIDLNPPPPEEEFVNMEKEFNAKKAQFIQIDLEEFETNDRFDIIIASEVAEHCNSPTLLFRKINKLLTNEGYAVITFPNMLFYSERWNFF